MIPGLDSRVGRRISRIGIILRTWRGVLEEVGVETGVRRLQGRLLRRRVRIRKLWIDLIVMEDVAN